jgi:hypothetical protein
MIKTKSIIAMMAGALVFSCVLSCDDENGKMESSKQFTAKGKAGSTSAPNRSGGVPDFDGSEGDPLDLGTAKKWAANYRATLSDADEIQAHYFGFEIIKQILSQPGCVGIRMYYAIDDSGEKKLILVGVDSNGENLMPSENGKTSDEGNILGDYSLPCPDYCPGIGL